MAHPQAAASRRTLVLNLMLSQGYLTQSQFNKWNAAPMPDPKDVSLPSTQGVAAPYFANYVKDQLVSASGPRRRSAAGSR